MLFLSEQNFVVAFEGGFSPFLRHELPVVVRLRIHRPHLADFLRQVMPLVHVRMPDHALLQLILGDAGTHRQQFTAAIGTIAVHHHLIPFMLVEGLAVGHAENLHLLSVGLREVHLVVDATGRVEVEGIVLESRPLLVARRIVVTLSCGNDQSHCGTIMEKLGGVA